MQLYKYLGPVVLGAAIVLSGCHDEKITTSVDTDTLVSSYVKYTDDDFYKEWQSKNFTKIILHDTSVTTDGEGGVLVDGQLITIKTSGTYVLEGTLSDGQILVDTEDTGVVRLIMNGVSITSQTTAPIYVKQSDKTVISLEDGTENILTDATQYVFDENTDELGAAIFSKDDLTINGTGALVVNANYNDGITGRDRLLITGGNITVHAADDGIVGRDVFAMRDANITIEAEGDGVKSSNDEAEKKGNIVLESGALKITAGGDGIQSEKAITVIDGDYSIISGGGSPETISTQEMGGGQRPEMPTGEKGQLDPSQMAYRVSSEEQSQTDQNQSTTTEEEDVSSKGIKAGTALTIIGGSISIDALDDGLHSNEDLTIQGGKITLSSGDDGIHADADVAITGGVITIGKSYEGVEGNNITLTDGEVRVVAADDGINVNGGSSEFGMRNESQTTTPTTEDSQLLIEGGYLYVNANGDGLDSNTTIKMTAGTVIVYGPTNNGNGSLDYDGTFTIEGGTLIAAGSSGMAQGVSDSSTQGTIMMTFDETQEANTTVNVATSDGKSIFTVSPEKQFQSIVISTPDVQQGKTYTFSSGGTAAGDSQDGLYKNATYTNGTQSVEFTQESVMTYINKEGITEKQSGGMMGRPGGEGGNRPARGERPTNPSTSE